MTLLSSRFTLLAALLSLDAVSINPSSVEAVAISARRVDLSSPSWTSGTHKSTRDPLLPLPTRSEKSSAQEKHAEPKKNEEGKGEEKKKDKSGEHEHDKRVAVHPPPWHKDDAFMSIDTYDPRSDAFKPSPSHSGSNLNGKLSVRGAQAFFHARRQHSDAHTLHRRHSSHEHTHEHAHKRDHDHDHDHDHEHIHDHDHDYDHDHDHDHSHSRRDRPARLRAHPRSTEKRTCPSKAGYADVISNNARLASLLWNATLQSYDISEKEASTLYLEDCGSSIISIACNNIPGGGCLTYPVNGDEGSLTCQSSFGPVPPQNGPQAGFCQVFAYNSTSGQFNMLDDCNPAASQSTEDDDSDAQDGDSPDSDDNDDSDEYAGSTGNQTSTQSSTHISLMFRPVSDKLDVETTNSTSYNMTSSDNSDSAPFNTTSPSTSSCSIVTQTVTTTVTVSASSSPAPSPAPAGAKVEVFDSGSSTTTSDVSSQTSSADPDVVASSLAASAESANASQTASSTDLASSSLPSATDNASSPSSTGAIGSTVASASSAPATADSTASSSQPSASSVGRRSSFLAPYSLRFVAKRSEN